MKLGQGWNHLSAGVWEHPSGMRANSVIARMPDGTIVQRVYDEKNFNRFVAINGGNVRRGMLAWANQQLAKWTAEQAEQHILGRGVCQHLCIKVAKPNQKYVRNNT
jgi:hypothetical protein